LEEEGGLNLFCYVANDPINSFDLIGLQSVKTVTLTQVVTPRPKPGQRGGYRARYIYIDYTEECADGKSTISVVGLRTGGHGVEDWPVQPTLGIPKTPISIGASRQVLVLSKITARIKDCDKEKDGMLGQKVEVRVVAVWTGVAGVEGKVKVGPDFGLDAEGGIKIKQNELMKGSTTIWPSFCCACSGHKHEKGNE
jgi:hypothetical protein